MARCFPLWLAGSPEEKQTYGREEWGVDSFRNICPVGDRELAEEKGEWSLDLSLVEGEVAPLPGISTLSLPLRVNSSGPVIRL